MLVKSLIALLACVAQVHAFIGISIHMYEPACAYACRAVIAGAMLDCPASHADHLQARHGHDTEVTPFCRSHNEPFLSTLAYCINQTCVVDGVVKSDIEHFWENVATGGDVNDPLPPIWSWAQALDLVKSVPTEEYNSEEELEETALVPQNQYYDQFRTLQNFAAGEGRHTRYSLAILLVGFSIPILATLAYYLPFAHTIITKLKPYLIYPAKPVHLTICNLPNLGQTWYIVIFIILNIIFTAVGYHSIQPNMWYTSRYQEILSYVSARTGVIAMAEAPLVFLFAGRNNILLWLTNWDHSTYLLLHRWIARIFTLHVIIHSVGELAVYVDMDMYKENLVQPYWIWGCVATVACAVMCIKSIFRSYHYEIFIILHIILAVFILAGTWYHLIYRFDYQWGYHLWMYAVFAVWAFDRVLRALRIAKAGWLNATVTDLGGVITRVDIHGVRWDSQPGKHAYIYFPLVNKYTPWQSHPFSVIPTRLLQRHSVEHDEKAGDSSEASSSNHLPLSTVALPSTGVTFYVKGHSGLTRRLLNSCSHGSVRALVEGPYGNNTSNLLRCDRLVLISGGIGITATLPYTFAHINSKLYWSVRTPMTALVNDITPSLHPVCERDIKIGSRFDVGSVIEAEVASWGSGLIAVVVCGPVGMCDDVRKEVVRVSKATGAKIELKVEAFSW